ARAVGRSAAGNSPRSRVRNPSSRRKPGPSASAPHPVQSLPLWRPPEKLKPAHHQPHQGDRIMAVDTSKRGKKPADAPFADAMGQAKNAADEFTRVIGQMKFPALPDAEALLATYRRNMDALSSANRIALEGAQSVAKRHMEIMQQQMTELTDAM